MESPKISFKVEALKPLSYSAAPMALMKLKFRNRAKSVEVVSVVGKIVVFVEYPLYINVRPELAREALSFSQVVTGPFKDEAEAEAYLPVTAEMDAALLLRFKGREVKKIPLVAVLEGFALYREPESGRVLYYTLPSDPPLESRFILDFEDWNTIIRTFYGGDLIWIKIRRDVLEKLEELKRSKFYPSYSEMLEDILRRAEEDGLL
ncbi:MAG: DUF6084 family protein [Desulfurococcales archaeon]|nr:DUF6084 family protein [Desulfurococcales archaeon]